jgi:hypothetical protein
MTQRATQSKCTPQTRICVAFQSSILARFFAKKGYCYTGQWSVSFNTTPFLSSLAGTYSAHTYCVCGRDLFVCSYKKSRDPNPDPQPRYLCKMHTIYISPLLCTRKSVCSGATNQTLCVFVCTSLSSMHFCPFVAGACVHFLAVMNSSAEKCAYNPSCFLFQSKDGAV